MMMKLREPVSGLTHLAGVLLSILGMVMLLIQPVVRNNSVYLISSIIFCISLILLYTASTLYHLLPISPKAIKVLRKIDHMMIYILIAGSYTPICLIALKGVKGYVMLSVVWIFALAGIFLKITWFNAPRWLYTLFYVVMGWLAVLVLGPLSQKINIYGLLWLFGGGLAYTVGAVIYALKSPKLNFKYFGFHEVFHLFVLLGSFCHYYLMFRYVFKI